MIRYIPPYKTVAWWITVEIVEELKAILFHRCNVRVTNFFADWWKILVHVYDKCLKLNVKYMENWEWDLVKLRIILNLEVSPTNVGAPSGEL